MLLDLVLVAVVIAVIAVIAMQLRSAEGAPLDKLTTAAQRSWTIIWNAAVAAGSTLLLGASYVADFFALPEVKAAITQYVSPTRMGVVVLVVTIVTILARLRTLKPPE